MSVYNGVFPSSITPKVPVTRPARQRLAVTTGTTQSITRDQIVGTASDFTLYLFGPTGTLLRSFTLNSVYSGWTVTDIGSSPFSVWFVTVPVAEYTAAGQYSVTIIYGSGAEYQSDTVVFAWGGWIDTLYANAATAASGASSASTAATQATIAATQSTTAATQATTAATQSTTAATQATTAATQATTAATQSTAAAADAEAARKMLTNRIAPNDATAPTQLTVYDDDGTTPLGTRTIGNADGTAVSPAQILSLGALV